MGPPPGLGGRPVRQEPAQGILIAALGMLTAHVGHARAGLQKEAEQVPIITVGARSSCGYRIHPTPVPFDLQTVAPILNCQAI